MELTKKARLEHIVRDYKKFEKCDNRSRVSGIFLCDKTNTDCLYVGQTLVNLAEESYYKHSCDYWCYYEMVKNKTEKK